MGNFLAINPTVASEIVLSEKPAITIDAARSTIGHTGQPSITRIQRCGTQLGTVHPRQSHLIFPCLNRCLFAAPPHYHGSLSSSASPSLGPIVVQGPGPIEPGASSPYANLNSAFAAVR